MICAVALLLVGFGLARSHPLKKAGPPHDRLYRRVHVLFQVHPAEPCAGLKKGGHADPIGSCVQRLPTRRSACPPACCITPSASAAIGTPAPTITAARSPTPSSRSPTPAAVRPAARVRSSRAVTSNV